MSYSSPNMNVFFDQNVYPSKLFQKDPLEEVDLNYVFCDSVRYLNRKRFAGTMEFDHS